MPEPRSIYPKHYFQQDPPASRRDAGFILMPFKKEFVPVYEAIKEAMQSAGLNEASKANDLKNYNTRAAMEEILRGIAEANVVVADMTGANENVFYEVGIAHTVKENVVLITQDTSKLPFDSQHIPHIPYDSSEEGLRKLTEELSQVISSLPDEPRFEIRSASIAELSVAEIRHELRRLLRACEQEWRNSIIPDQIAVFEQKFRGPLSVRPPQKEHDALIEESITDIQPAFLRPWQPIESMGFEVIEHEKADVLPKFIEALAHAYNLRSTDLNDVSTVWGHGQLLALRTWTLWGAKALECENWDAVAQMLHYETAFYNFYRGEIRTSFCRYRRIHFPDATALHQGSGRVDLASRSIYRQTDEFAQTLFHDLAEMKGFIGLWLFASDLAHAVAIGYQEGLIWPSWFLAPKTQINKLLRRLESDSVYSREFAQAVVNADPSTLNETWQSGLRDQLLDRTRLGSGYHPWVLEDFQLPKRFAE